MTFLTPLAALAALAALVPLAAAALGRIRVRSARRALGLVAPSRRRGATRLGAAVTGVVLLGLAAAQPALTQQSRARERTGVAVLFAVDVSRSMSASLTPTSPTRLERAVSAALGLRAAIPQVAAGVATLTDRVLPDLMPVPDLAGFDGVMQRAIAIESPAPASSGVVATTYASLDDVAAGNYFEPGVTRRVIVLLTDGESNPFDPASVASAMPASAGWRFLAIRFWNARELVYDSGRAEPGYHPLPTGAAILSGLAAATGGRFFEEDNLGAAASYLRRIVGRGPTILQPAPMRSPQPLAPWLAGVAALLLLAAIAPRPAAVRAVGARLAASRHSQ
jgi:hypothetical protein